MTHAPLIHLGVRNARPAPAQLAKLSILLIGSDATGSDL